VPIKFCENVFPSLFARESNPVHTSWGRGCRGGTRSEVKRLRAIRGANLRLKNQAAGGGCIGPSEKSSRMPFIRLKDAAVKEIFPGFKVRFVHSATMTFAHWEIDAGAVLPEHSHPHEQVVNVIAGEFDLTISGETERLGSGMVGVIPSNAIHSGRAVTKCHIIDAFYPIREDYRK
jgi:quercetin dioxygenase-like cupin family protein